MDLNSDHVSLLKAVSPSHLGGCIITLASLRPKTPINEAISPSYRRRGWRVGRRRPAAPTASARPASQTPASQSSASPWQNMSYAAGLPTGRALRQIRSGQVRSAQVSSGQVTLGSGHGLQEEVIKCSVNATQPQFTVYIRYSASLRTI